MMMLLRCFRKVSLGEAFIRNGAGGPKVSFSGIVIVPHLHSLERLDLTVRKIEIHCTGPAALVCNDGARAELIARFFLRINATESDVLRVVNEIGVARSSDSQALRELFAGRFADGLVQTAREFTYDDVEHYRERFGDAVRQRIGANLSGFTLHEVVVSDVRKTG